MDSLNCVSQESLLFIFIFKRIFTGCRILVDGFVLAAFESVTPSPSI